MDHLSLASDHSIPLAPLIRSNHPFFSINPTTILNTWVVLALMYGFAWLVRSIIYRHKRPPLLHFAILSGAEFITDICTSALGTFSLVHTTFIATLFIFILLCNTISIIPWFEEPTVDFNTTLALSLISFLYIQASAIFKHGLIAYIKGYFSPFFFMLPLNIISRSTSIISMSLRLFGNIFGGAIMMGIALTLLKKSILFEIAGIIPNLILALFFVIFEGILQAYVFSNLSLIFLSMAYKDEGGH